MKRRMTITLYQPGASGTFHPDLAHSWSLEREEFSNGYPVFSGLMVCPICCNVWAKLAIEGREFYEARSIPCPVHPRACHEDIRPVAGSLLDNPTANGYDEPLLAALPQDLLHRELKLHLAAKWDD